MGDQTERAFQKQPTIFLARKGGLKKSESRWVCSPGLGFKVPREAREGNYIDKKCPFTGKVSIRGRILTGVITKMKMNRTVVIRRDYLHYVKNATRTCLYTCHLASGTSKLATLQPLVNADLSP